MVATPDFTEKVVGFRGWRFNPRNPLQLGSATAFNRNWKPGVNKAECDFCNGKMRNTCSCGFHAFRTLRDFMGSNSAYGYRHLPIVGVVTLWGSMDVDPLWIKSEYAQVEAIAVCPHSNCRIDGWMKAKRLLPKIASMYGVPTIKAEQLEVASAFYGAQLPSEFASETYGNGFEYY